MGASTDYISPSDPDYFPSRFRPVDGTPRRTRSRVLICSDPLCTREGEIGDNGSAELPPDIVRKKFQQKGWEVGKNRTHDVCPICVENRASARRSKKEAPLKPVIVTAPPPHRDFAAEEAAEAPKKMDTEDRRIIFAAVDERWAGKDAGYSAPWTDQAIASHLGVPLAWVIEVRSQFFGEVRDNQEIRDLLERVDKVSVAASQKVAEAFQLHQKMIGFNKDVNALNASVQDMKKSLEGLIAIAQRIERSVK